MASDLRASAALILAGLAATGDMGSTNLPPDRGYENFEQKLSRLGANVERLPESELPKSISSSSNLVMTEDNIKGSEFLESIKHREQLMLLFDHLHLMILLVKENHRSITDNGGCCSGSTRTIKHILLCGPPV